MSNSRSRRQARAEAGALGTDVASPAPALATPPASPPIFSGFSGFSGARAPGVRPAPWSAPQLPRGTTNGHAGTTASSAAPAPAPTNGSATNGAVNGHAHPAAGLPYVQQQQPAPPPPAFTGDTYNQHQERAAAQQQRQAARPNAPVPQGSTQLCNDWARCVFATSADGTRQNNPSGCTIWLLSLDEPRYEVYLPGLSVVANHEGEQPARALFDGAGRVRRYPDQAEHFVGRIEMLTTDGRMVQIGGGFLDLAPVQRAPAPPPPPPYGAQPNYYAQAPQYGAPPGYPPPYGMPPGYPPPGYPPPGYPPPYGGMGMPFYPPPPAYGAHAGMLPYFAPIPGANAPPPAAVAKDASALEQWTAMQKATTTAQEIAMKSQFQMLEFMAKNNGNNNNNGNGQTNADAMFDKALGWVERLNGLRPAEKGGEPSRATILDADGTKLIINKDGDVDAVATGLIGLRQEVRSVVEARSQAAAAARSATGNGGAAPGLSTARAPGVKSR